MLTIFMLRFALFLEIKFVINLILFNIYELYLNIFQLYVSPKLAMVALGIVPPIAVMSIIYGRYVRKITRKVQDSLAGATSVSHSLIITICFSFNVNLAVVVSNKLLP